MLKDEPITCNQCGHTGVPKTYFSGKHLRADCEKCSRYIKFLPQNNPAAEYRLWFGKYARQSLQEIADKTGGIDYLQWVLNEFDDEKVKLKVREFLASRTNV